MTATSLAGGRILRIRRRTRTAAGSRPPRQRGDSSRSFLITLIAVLVVAAFLSPLLRSVAYSLKSIDQIPQAHSPLYPADPVTFDFNGKDLPGYNVPLPDGTMRQLAIVEALRRQSTFVDPQDPTASPIVWQGSWRTLEPVWQFAPHWENFGKVWDLIDYPRLLLNTVIIALISTIGTLISCTLVAYGFARFRFPGRSFLFTLLIATIFLPAAVTIIPTYTIFYKLGWIGTWLPLLVPAFLANAYDVFLLRQYLLTIPHDLDEAAAIDGAGSLRILRSVILPQAWPVILAVTIFTFVYSWNDYFGPLIYLAGHEEMQPLQVALAHFHSIYFSDSTLILAGNIMTLVIP